MATRYKLYYGSSSDKHVGVFDTDPLDGWNGESKTLRLTDYKGKAHTLQLGPDIHVRSVAFTPSSGQIRVL